MSYTWTWEFVAVDYSEGSFIPYCSPDQANNYFQYQLKGKDWQLITPSDKELALYQATICIDNLRFAGYKTSPAQRNQFPRNKSTEVPVDIIEACAEIALSLASGVNPDLEAIQAGFEVSTVVSARVAKNPVHAPAWILAGIPSLTAWHKLMKFLDDGMGISLSRV